MVGLASVKILHELRCHEVFEDMDDVTRYPDFVHFCYVTFTWFIPSKQCCTKCTFLKEGKYFFFLPVVDSLSFCALDASLLLFRQTFTSSNYDNIECQGILPQIFI